MASFNGMPTSRAMILPISSERAFSPSWIFCRNAARPATGVAAHPSNAARAARTAASTSAALPSGIRAMTSSVDPQTTSILPAPAQGTHRPSM